MYRKAYIVVFDPSEIDKMQLSNAVKSLHSAGIIKNWWHYIKTCYILISDRTGNELSEKIAGYISGKKKYFVVEINLKNRQGYLLPDAWEWIKTETSKIS